HTRSHPQKIPKSSPSQLPNRRRGGRGGDGGDHLPHPAGEFHVPLQLAHRARRARQLHHRAERQYASTQTLAPCGCRAKNTQRAATIKDFIKTGCSYAAIAVDINNQGEDSFKPDLYGNLIKLERRITESSSSTILKDQHGRKVANRKDDLNEIIEHFNVS
uniref:Uncharacterized protein n=1 Tax=Triticum urartu TaxID=4572 RepID=A0A8R7RBN3_TRIUA